MQDIALSGELISDELKGLPASKAQEIKAVFYPMIEMVQEFEGAFNELMSEEQTTDKCKRAKELRNAIGKVRIKADKVRKEHKAQCLREGRAIDGACNVFKDAIADKEEKLKEVETYYERQEDERITKIQAEREAELVKYNVRMEAPCMLGKMTEDVWVNYLNGVKLNWEAVKEAERKAEEDGKLRAAMLKAADVLMKEKVKKVEAENERLKVERERLGDERKQRQAELQEERKQREHLEAAKQLQERARKAQERQRKEAERKRALAPDKEKLLYFADALQKKKDTLESQEAKGAMSRAADVLRDAASKLG